MTKERIIAESIVDNFLLDKYKYIGEPLHRGKVEMINRSLSESRLTFLVYMYLDKNKSFKSMRKEIENEAIAYSDELISKLKELNWSI